MTMNVYGHVNVDTQRVATDRLDDELAGWPRCYQLLLSPVPPRSCTPAPTCRSAARIRTWTRVRCCQLALSVGSVT
jgi:hypothetical protein